MTDTKKPESPQLVKFEKTKAHVRYKTKTGIPVVGVTTVLGVMNKPALVHWAWDLGMQGLDFRKVKDQAADIGTLAHWMCECHLQGLKPDTSPFSAEDIDAAENSFLKFLEWWDKAGLELIKVKDFDGIECTNEVRMVSETYLYGGTLDLPCRDKEGRMVLVDFKTSKGVYPEYWYQCAAYSQMFEENTGHPFDRHIIIKIGKKLKGDFEVHERQELTLQWKIFLAALKLHTLLKTEKG